MEDISKSKEEISDEIEQLEDEVEEIKLKLKSEDTDHGFTGKAFVIYNQQSDIENITWKFQITWVRRVYDFIIHKVFRRKSTLEDTHCWDNNRIIIERAAEPTNIYWENMAVTESTRFKRSLITY